MVLEDPGSGVKYIESRQRDFSTIGLLVVNLTEGDERKPLLPRQVRPYNRLNGLSRKERPSIIYSVPKHAVVPSETLHQSSTLV